MGGWADIPRGVHVRCRMHTRGREACGQTDDCGGAVSRMFVHFHMQDARAFGLLLGRVGRSKGWVGVWWWLPYMLSCLIVLPSWLLAARDFLH